MRLSARQRRGDVPASAPQAPSRSLPRHNAAEGPCCHILSNRAPKKARGGLPCMHTIPSAEVAALEAIGLRKSLPLSGHPIEILKGIDIRIAKGELVALIGPSGSGKSTLLGIIAGLDAPTSGQVCIDGVDITRKSEGQLARVRNQKIGMVFQAFNLIPTLTAQENVETPLYVGKHRYNASARAKELLTLVGLGQRLAHRPTQLSGGEQQRVAVARALATAPAIIIMDEPTGNLDQRNSEQVLQMISTLREQTGATFVIATHDSRVASAADRAIHLLDGLVVAEEAG